MILGEKVTMQEILNDIPKRSSRRMQKNSGGEKTPDREADKTLLNVKDVSCSLMMGIPTKEWDNLPFPGTMFYQTSSHIVLKMEAKTYEAQ